MAEIADKRSPEDEKFIIRRAINGDSDAFGVLYGRYLDAIYRYLYYRIGDASLGEDLTEEVFVRAWESLPKYKLSKYPFKSWLYRIAHNLLVDTQRKQTPLLISDEDMDRNDSHQLLPEEAVTQQQDSVRLSIAVQKLEEIEQQVVLLRFVDGLSHREVGNIIGKSEQACRVIQYRALNALHAHLVKEEETHG